jgi:lipoprotein signal peptidase
VIAKTSFYAWTAAFISGAAVFAIDQWLKASLFDGHTYEGEAFSFANGLIRSTLHHNYGISFNIPIPQVVIVLITGIALGWAMALLIERARASQLAACILIGIFIGGTLGNAFDRLTLGFVRDWMLLFGRSAINFADVCIGGSLLAYLWHANRAKS